MKNIVIFTILIYITLSKIVFARVYTFPSSIQEITVVDNGQEAFYHRLQLIENAQSSINLEYFIFNTKNPSTQILLKELLKKAKEGVSIKILIDNFYYNLSRPLSNILISAGIKIKKFNPYFMLTKKGQHRNHRKLFSIDGTQAVIGGRNISDEYFDIGKDFNFHDRDLLVNGPAVVSMDESFSRFWNSKLSKTIKLYKAPRRPSPSKNNKADNARRRYKSWMYQLRDARKIFANNAKLESLKTSMIQNGVLSYSINQTFQCSNSIFATDEPGKIGKNNKDASVYLYNKLANTSSSILIETPYFVPKKIEYNLFNNLLSNNINIEIITNGVNGTDAAIISAIFLDRVSFFIDKGMKAYIHPGQNIFNSSDKRLWALHNKAFIFDNSDVVIGSYNLDPRSLNLNAEMVFECRNNAALVQLMKGKFYHTANQSIQIGPDGKPLTKEDTTIRFKFKKLSANLLKHIIKYFDFLL